MRLVGSVFTLGFGQNINAIKLLVRVRMLDCVMSFCIFAAITKFKF